MKTPDGTTVTYDYDGRGLPVRRSSTVGDERVVFHDPISGARALETDAAGNVTARYILDSAGQPIAQEITGVAGRSYFVQDPRHNLSQLLGSSGAVIGTWAYDPFGRDAGSLGNSSALGYQMAPKDSATGSYMLGSRLYDPDINRFVGADHYASATSNMELQLDPLTGNRYLYAGANPVNLIDDGHRWQWVKNWHVSMLGYASWEWDWRTIGSGGHMQWRLDLHYSFQLRSEVWHVWWTWEDVDSTCGHCYEQMADTRQKVLSSLVQRGYAIAAASAPPPPPTISRQQFCSDRRTKALIFFGLYPVSPEGVAVSAFTTVLPSFMKQVLHLPRLASFTNVASLSATAVGTIFGWNCA